MDLDPTDEQKALAEALGDLLDKRYEPRTRLELLDSERGWSEALWKQYADMGLLGLTFDEEVGGAGMGTAELATVAEQFGRALVLEPFLASVVLGGGLVAAAGTAEQRREVLPGVAAGETQLAYAWAEPGRRYADDATGTTATRAGDAWTLTGRKVDVLGGDSADRFVVSAVLPDGGLGLFLVDAADVRRTGHAQQDGLRAADVQLDSATAVPLGEPGADTRAAVDEVVDVATAMLCAEAVGAIDRMLWLTVDYLKTRVQFGTPISAFQALQFRAADMYVSLEQARSMALMARIALGGDPAERRRAVRAAKLQVDLAARHVGQEAIQLHGGIGMTMEYPVGHFVKRTTVIAKTFDDTDGLTRTVGEGAGLVASA